MILDLLPFGRSTLDEAGDRFLHSSDDPAPDLADLAGPPRPGQVVPVEELWETISDSCPPGHRPILELKRQSLSLAEIASRVGLHEGSVRRILSDLARRLTWRWWTWPGGPGRRLWPA